MMKADGFMKTISSSEMGVVDINCEFHGLSRLQLMENAGKAIADEIEKRFSGGRVVVFAGTGNNGGDSFVAIRHLKGFDCEVLLLGRESEIKTDISRRNFSIIKKCGVIVREIKGINSPKEIEADGDIVIDAMLGTGVKGSLKEPFRSAVEKINSLNAFVVAVDVPTGMNPDTGEYDICVKADLTVTFHRNKKGLLKSPEVAGEIVVRDIGIPDLFEKLCGPGDVQLAYKRDPQAHKGMHGRVLVIGGGVYTGAPTLTALACLNTGADIVTLAIPESIAKVVASFSPNLIVRRLRGDRISFEHIGEIENLVRKHDVIAMGMGVGEKEFKEVSEEILKIKNIKKVVLDAEAITKNVPENVECILTPHKGEFRRVFGVENPSEEDVRRQAERMSSVILLKSVRDVISDGEKIRINPSGNPGMTVGGTGDVLAGIVSAFFTRASALWSASAGAFVNGFAGDLCVEEKGYNFTATDVIDKIPLAIKKSLEFR
jgi:NAD(P)H-hydrate epimerase